MTVNLDHLNDRDFVRYCMEEGYRRLEALDGPEVLMLPAREADAEPEDGGVPAAMQAGPVDPAGWVKWKLLPSTVTDRDLDALETELKIKLPPVFRAYLSTCFHCFEGTTRLRVMSQLPGRPLDGLRRMQDLGVLGCGYLAFGLDEQTGGCLCLDLRRGRLWRRWPVVELDPDGVTGLDEPITRRKLRPLLRPVARDFRPWLAEVLLGE